jgi:hypothetical protein
LKFIGCCLTMAIIVRPVLAADDISLGAQFRSDVSAASPYSWRPRFPGFFSKPKVGLHGCRSAHQFSESIQHVFRVERSSGGVWFE